MLGEEMERWGKGKREKAKNMRAEGPYMAKNT